MLPSIPLNAPKKHGDRYLSTPTPGLHQNQNAQAAQIANQQGTIPTPSTVMPVPQAYAPPVPVMGQQAQMPQQQQVQPVMMPGQGFVQQPQQPQYENTEDYLATDNYVPAPEPEPELPPLVETEEFADEDVWEQDGIGHGTSDEGPAGMGMNDTGTGTGHGAGGSGVAGDADVPDNSAGLVSLAQTMQQLSPTMAVVNAVTGGVGDGGTSSGGDSAAAEAAGSTPGSASGAVGHSSEAVSPSDAGGGGGGGGGGTVICTALHEMGELPEGILYLDEIYGKEHVSEELYMKYLKWAAPIVPKIKAKHWWYYTIAKILAPAWAQHMAAIVSNNESGKKSILGWLTTTVGEWYIGRK